ncbi:TldD/PmbA family protein [Myxococcus stipitatus]|uniref:TldD/PmbA family protein n=1 Tax=Myxococcus stipitatus TaxID=83455 RepID=UPI0030CAF768
MTWFVERREVSDVLHLRSGLRIPTATFERGVSSHRDTSGGGEHSWVELTRDEPPPGLLPREVLDRARAPLARPRSLADGAPLREDVVRRLVETARSAGAAHLEVTLREVDRWTLCATEARLVEQHTRHALLEVKAFHGASGPFVDAWRCVSHPDAARLHAHLPSLETWVERLVCELRETTPSVECPTGALPIIFPPGAASACFFHEVCGHPLEGDVVAREGSFLARLSGQRVAEPWVSISDDPTDAQGALGFAWDDEGLEARAVPLLREGVVTSPLLDTRSARLLGLESNGHGRRVDFRHPPLPRMAHTRVEPHQGSLESLLAGVPHGLLVQHLTPRHMNLLSGDFSFYIVEAREVRDGRPGPRVGPGILAGNGLEALATIDGVGADTRNLFATRGCRKLDHGPLPVSFGQPSVRFKSLHVRPWT